MAHKIDNDDGTTARRREELAGARLGLGCADEAYAHARQDPRTDELMKLLREMSHHDMAAC